MMGEKRYEAWDCNGYVRVGVGRRAIDRGLRVDREGDEAGSLREWMGWCH